MATRMTENGVSTTQKGQEQYETFVISTRPKRKAVQYDYRSAETGELFTIVRPTHHRPPYTGTMQGEAGRMAQRERTEELTEQVGRTKIPPDFVSFMSRGRERNEAKETAVPFLKITFLGDRKC